jgi:hypothetical protein
LVLGDEPVAQIRQLRLLEHSHHPSERLPT